MWEWFGSDQTYKTLAIVIPKYATNGHTIDHFIGESLYNVSGLEGVARCKSTYSNGCTHEIINRHIAKNGFNSYVDVLRVCESTPKRTVESCLHGLGHGLLRLQ